MIGCERAEVSTGIQSIGGANGFDMCEVVGVDCAKNGDGNA